MSTMTEIRLNGMGVVPSAALLFESDAVKAEPFDAEHLTVKEEVVTQDLRNLLDTGAIKEEVEDDSKTPSLSRSVSVDAMAHSSSSKSTPSATPAPSGRSKGKATKAPAQLIGHLPRAEGEAMKVFVEIPSNHYQYGTLGKSREALESMTCDCQYEHGVDDTDAACGPHSDCINRLTQVECMPDDCRCRAYCQNQRFQRRQYAPIEIVKTEMKGFGLRAAQDIPKDAFIYEYVGDVVSQPSFLKRMRQYAEEGIRHFYFMMLQKDEFIDATKRGGIGRFANHSCSPNCYVAKWTVGEHVRMGIFAHRHIKQFEELTFNYNVDRYGHDAQPCYCGEPNCVGFIGGKTQTDIAAMDDLYLDALGITEEVEKLGLKGSKKKKGKKLDEDFIPDLKPILFKDIPKVVQAMRQTQSRKVLVKLLTRIKLTDDMQALRQIMRLRGFSVMTNILEDNSEDAEICTLAMECMKSWPLIQRNKVEDSKVFVPVDTLKTSENETVSALATSLIAQWDNLECAYRIPKRGKSDADDAVVYEPVIILNHDSDDERPAKRSRAMDDYIDFVLPSERNGPHQQVAVYPTVSENSKWFRSPSPDIVTRMAEHQKDVAAIIKAAAQRAEEARAAQREEEQRAKLLSEMHPQQDGVGGKDWLPPMSPKAKERRKSSHGTKPKEREREKKPSISKEEKEANKEKRLLKLIGAVVVKCMSKYQNQMDSEQFKKYAKELTHVIAEKEKKSTNYKEGKLDSLSEEKTNKIKKFAKEYIVKVLRKLEKSGKRRKRPSTAASSSTPDNRADNDDNLVITATVEDVMDLDPDHDLDDRADFDVGHSSDREEDQEEDERRASGSASGSPEDAVAGSGETSPTVVSDPRIRRQPEKSVSWDLPPEKMDIDVRRTAKGHRDTPPTW